MQATTSTLIWDNVWPVDLDEVSVGNDWDKLSRFAEAGYTALGVTLAGDNHDVLGALQLIARARRFVAEHHDRYLLAHSTSDIEQAKESGKMAVVLHFEGTRCLGGHVDLIEPLSTLGVKMNLLAFNNANESGGGCVDATDEGLKPLGKEIVREMQRVGMLVDLSHVGHRTSLEALELAERPMVFSHSNVYAIQPCARNIKDDQISACAATGGLIGVSGCSEYLGDPESRTEALFRHVDYLAELVGAQHVGLGLDVVFDTEAVDAYMRSRPQEWPWAADENWPGMTYAMPEQVADLVSVMKSHGYDRTSIEGILGRNMMRVADAAW